MKVRSFNQFAEWYVLTLTHRELVDAGTEVKMGLNRARKSAVKSDDDDIRKHLISWWKLERTGLKVSEVFDKKHRSAREYIVDKSRDELRALKDNSWPGASIRDLAFVMAINPDIYIQEIGFELASQYPPDEVREMQELKEKNLCRGCMRRIKERYRTVRRIDQDSISKDLEEINLQINDLKGMTTDYKDKADNLYDVMMQMLAARVIKHINDEIDDRAVGEIKECLQRFTPEISETLIYHGISSQIPMDVEAYQHIELMDSGILNILNQIVGLAGEWREINLKQISTWEEEQEISSRKAEMHEELLDNVQQVSIMLVEQSSREVSITPEEIRDHWNRYARELSDDIVRLVQEGFTDKSSREGEEETGDRPLPETARVSEPGQDDIEENDDDNPRDTPWELGDDETDGSKVIVDPGISGEIEDETEGPGDEEEGADEDELGEPTETDDSSDDVDKEDTAEGKNELLESQEVKDKISGRGAEQEVFIPDPAPLVENDEEPGDIQGEPADIDLPGIDEYLYCFIKKKDTSWAYWLCREFEDTYDCHEGLKILPSWLFLAASLADYADWDGQDEKDIMFDICTTYAEPVGLLEKAGVSHRTAAMLAGAVSLRPVFFAPEASANTWLQSVSEYISNGGDKLGDFFRPVLEIQSYGKKFDRELIRQSYLDDDWQNKAVEAAERVKSWKNSVKLKHSTFVSADNVLKSLSGKDSVLSTMFKFIENKDINGLNMVKRIYEDYLSDRKKIIELINDTDLDLRGRQHRGSKIHGKPLEHLIRQLEELAENIRGWISTSKAGVLRDSRDDWMTAKVQDLKKEVTEYREPLKEEINRTLEQLPPDEYSEKIALILASQLIDRFADELINPSFNDEQRSPWQYVMKLPLLFTADPPINEYGEIDFDVAFSSSDPLLKAVVDRHTLKEALEMQLDNGDFATAELIIQELRKQDISDYDKLDEEYRSREIEFWRSLNNELRDTRSKLEQAMIDHVLSEESRTVIDGQLLSIEESDTRRPYKLRAELQQIKQELDKMRRQRYDSLLNNIEQMEHEIYGKKDTLVANVKYNAAKENLDKAREALKMDNLPVADEYLHFAEQVTDIGIEHDLEKSINEYNPVVEFESVIDKISQELESDLNKRNADALIDKIVKSIDKGRTFAGINMQRVRGARRGEIDSGLKAWLSLKQPQKPSNTNMATRYLIRLLEYIGFISPQVELKDSERQSLYYTAAMMPGAPSPLADFGSLRSGCYDIIVLFGRPNIDTIGQMLRNYGVAARCPIVIYMGRMTKNQRQEWSEYCKNHGLTALLIDELLIYYLAAQRDSRFPAAVSCGVAWGYVVPYRSFGVIPSEIFKGRQIMLKELIDPGGSCIVYGGRQFGKSVLLHMVQRQYNNPEQGAYVIYDDIKNIGDPQGAVQVSEIWTVLREHLVSLKILNKKASSFRDRLVEQIIDAIQKDNHLRITILLDEADNFLAADARQNFNDVQVMRRIMDRTERRFKVVFCGLHSVQRYCSGENHPFAQMMARPQVVGPLKPEAAVSLIVEPMNAVGFDITMKNNRDAILKILSYTNYNPALIQEFCAELIRQVRKNKDNPPYKIDLSNVEAVYRLEDLRSFMRDRFNWTLELDLHYKVLVYSMVFEQLQDEDGYRREFSTAQILEIARSYWPEGFSSVPFDEVKSLLEELIGLGILVKRSGAYRLRNGNVVRALGSEQEIFNVIDYMASQPPAPGYDDAGNLKLIIDEDGDRKTDRSPLTVKQASSLTSLKSGVALIYGSRALELERVPSTLRYILQSGSREGDQAVSCIELSPDIVTLRQLEDKVNKIMNRQQVRRSILFAYANQIDFKDNDLYEIIDYLADKMLRYKRRVRYLRFIILFDALDTYKWFNNSPLAAAGVEDKVDITVSLGRWNEEVLKRVLSDAEILGTSAVIDRILEVTGGWP